MLRSWFGGIDERIGSMGESKAKMAEATFTPELIEEMKSKRGMKLRVGNHSFNEEATKGAIKRFADGTGDPNPLWRDVEYGKNSRYGSIIAPPSWAFSVLAGIQFGWEGIAGFHSASDMEFYKPIKRDDKITPEETFVDFDGPKDSKFAGRLISDYFEDKYFNQNGELATKIVRLVIRTERAAAKKLGKYQKIELPHPWTEAELKDIEEQVLSEKVRGAEIRYWEDVTVGEKLTPVVKGPLGLTDIVAMCVAGLAPARLMAHGVALNEYRKKPAWAFRDPITNALEPIYAVHYNSEAARAMGLPFAYDVGTQRHTWQIHMLTNWMSDEGWLKKCRAEYRKFVYLSDVLWITGKVTNKFVDDDGEHCVEIETNAMNQRNEDAMPGSAVVALPSKSEPEEKWPVSRRIQ
jgi:acyl dehydratase